MFTISLRPAVVTLFSLYSSLLFANNETEIQQEDDRINIIITKGYSVPNATTQDYSGDTVINIVPTSNDTNKSIDEIIAANSPGFIHTNSGTTKHNSNNYHRGLSDEYTLYLLNGVPFPTTTLGSQNIPDIPVESIELIEVIRGSQASLYGSSSLTGVINIITKTGDTEDAKVNVSVGSHNSRRAAGVYANNIGNVQFMTSLDTDKSDGYNIVEASDENFGYQTYSMNSYAAYVTETNRFSLALNNAKSNLEYYDYSGKADSTAETLQLTGKYIQLFNHTLSSEFTISNANVEDTSGSSTSSDTDVFSTNETLVQFYLNHVAAQSNINLGGEFIHSEFDSNDDHKNREQGASYLALSNKLTRFVNISGGLRYDNYSDFGNAFTYSAGLSLFKIASLNYKTSFRAPSYNDLYYSSSYGEGNPDLEAEEGEILELSFTYNVETDKAFIPLKLNLYNGTLTNKISWEEVSSYFYSPVNVDQVDLKGIEAYLQYNEGTFIIDLMGAYTESIDKSTNEQLDNVPEWSGSSSVQYNISKRIKPKLIYTYIGKRTSSSGDLKAAHLVNLAINYQATQDINIAFNINNVTDYDDQLYSGYNTDGRTFLLTISADI